MNVQHLARDTSFRRVSETNFQIFAPLSNGTQTFWTLLNNVIIVQLPIVTLPKMVVMLVDLADIS